MRESLERKYNRQSELKILERGISKKERELKDYLISIKDDASLQEGWENWLKSSIEALVRAKNAKEILEVELDTINRNIIKENEQIERKEKLRRERELEFARQLRADQESQYQERLRLENENAEKEVKILKASREKEERKIKAEAFKKRIEESKAKRKK
jgi:hypothetical protein